MANGIIRRIEELKSSLSRLSQREKLMVGGLGGAFLFGLVVGLGYWIYSGVEDIEEENQATRQALQDMELYKDDYLKARKRMAAFEVLMSRDPILLSSYAEKAASTVGVSISESDKVTPVAADQFVQRGLEIKLRRISLSQLAKFLKQLEESQTHVVQVTSLSINARWGGKKDQEQELDAELIVSTYDRKQAEKKSEKTNGKEKVPKMREQS